MNEMLRDFFKLAWENITHRRMRSWLTIIGIVIGIAAVVALISLGQGLKYTVNEQFQKIGADKLIIRAKTGNYGPPGSTTSSTVLMQKDYNIVKRNEGVDLVAQRLMRQAKIEFNKKSVFSFVVGTPTDESRIIVEESGTFDVAEGRGLKDGDKNKVVLGSDFARQSTFGRQIQLNNKILINGEEFTVIGILNSSGNPGTNGAIYITLDQARTTFDTPDEISVMMAKIKIGEDINVVTDSITRDLRRSRSLKEGKEDFSVESPQKAFESFLTILNVVEVLLVGLASISMLVGAVGIANTMFTAVLERTREIGIMKSIGAKNSDILTIFLIEASLIGLIGGSIGIAMGVGIGKLAQAVIAYFLGTGFFIAFFPWYLIFGSLVFAIIIGIISGIVPARQAAAMNPVDALRK